MLKSFFNTFGREVPALIFGTWQLGGAYRFGGKPDGLGEMTSSTAQVLLDRAYRSGIRVFDTADIYGLGTVESLLSRLPGDAFVVTKFGNRGTSETRRKDFSRAHLVECLQRSGERLSRVPDLVLMHNPPPDFDFAQLAALEIDRLRADGLVKGFGVSCTTIPQASAALESDAVQAIEVNFNLLDRQAENALFQRADRLKKDVLLRAPFCSGFLTDRFVERNHGFDQDDRRSTLPAKDRDWRIEAVRKLKRELEVASIAETALRFCLSFSKSVVFGCRNVDQLEANLRHARLGALDEATLHRIRNTDFGTNPCW
jgi:aryl-alcohol dehydrogenase-like predicted oxidoreductase